MTVGLRNLFLANWKNKAVALFFAVSIWFLAYQSETREITRSISVRFQPLVEDTQRLFTIVGVKRGDEAEYGLREGAIVEAEVEFTGPRKRIAKLAERTQPGVVISVKRDQLVHIFEVEDFGDAMSGVHISKIEPKAVNFRLADVKERTISDLTSNVVVTEVGSSGKQVIAEILRPSSGELRIRGPEDRIRNLSVSLNVPMGYDTRPVQKEVTPRIVPGVDDVILNTVEFWDFERERWVPADEPPTVFVRVRLQEEATTFPCELAKLVFQLPVTQFACKITLKDVPPGTNGIPVEFRGPKEEIERLKQAYQNNRITLGVPPPPDFENDKGGTYTFSEDELRLSGFENVTIGQHASRKEQGRSFWTYEIEVLEKKEGSGE